MSEEPKIVKFVGNLSLVKYSSNPRYPLGKNDNNFGITIFRVREELEGNIKLDSKKSVVLKGHFTEEVQFLTNYTITAKEVVDPKYGVQYDLIFMFESTNFSDISNQKSFLKYFLTERQIDAFYATYEDPLKIIASGDIEALTKIKGVGQKTALRILRDFEKRKDYSALYLEFDQLNLTTAFIEKLKNRYQNLDTIRRILREDPYQLSYDVDGIGFKKADAIALQNGLNPKSPRRIEAFINYFLTQRAEEGDSYVTAFELTQGIFTEFGGKDAIYEEYMNGEGEIENNNVSLAIKNLTDKGILKIEEHNNLAERRVYLTKYYVLEEKIAFHLRRLLKSENNFSYGGWEKIIEQQEKTQGWEFTEEQRAGIKLGLDNQVCFITGSAGTGKSSLVSGILKSLEGYNFAQCSLSGKAAARLQEVTGVEGYTIHKLLGFNRKGFMYDKNTPLPYKIIIVDEISMIGGEIFLSLLEAIADGTKLIMLGDMGQLESIGSLNLASDIYESGVVPTVTLTKIHRQAQKSGIITSAYKIRNQEQIFDEYFEGEDIVGELQDMEFYIEQEKYNLREKVIDKFEEHYSSELIAKSVMDIQILAPVKERGELCVKVLNSDIQKIVNPINYEEPYLETAFGGFIHKGDKVMCTKNFYDLLSATTSEKVAVFNGWVGMVTEIDDDMGMVTIYFPIIHKDVLFKFEDARAHIILGYASTVHKWQGSSAKTVICVIDYGTPPQMRTKELLYTMLTRAEKRCILIGQNPAIRESIEKSGISEKRTFLKGILKCILEPIK